MSHYDAARNSERCHALAIKALREINIRNGNIVPNTPQEQEWKREGPREMHELDALLRTEHQDRVSEGMRQWWQRRKAEKAKSVNNSQSSV